MGIELGQMIILRLPQELIEECHLSVPKWDELNGKVGLCRDRKRAGPGATLPYRGYDEKNCLLPYEEHLDALNLKPEDAWLLIGIRNIGNNLRIIAWDRERGLLELDGENATTSARSYCCLCKANDGRLLIDELSFAGGKLSRSDLIWAASGQKLVWDGKPVAIDEIIPYTYDLRHVWRIPGTRVAGMGRAYAGGLIEEMINEFMEVADWPPQKAADKLIKFAMGKGYSRECDYLHSAIGISENGGTAIIVQRHGSFEKIAKTLIDVGAYRAIELDQGGSCSVMIGGSSQFSPGRTIFASHYFRPTGLALLVFRLGQLGEETFAEKSQLLSSESG